MKSAAAKIVPELINFEQKQPRMQSLKTKFKDDPYLLKKLITSDELWVYSYNIKTKTQSSQWKLPEEPRPKKTRQVPSDVKIFLRLQWRGAS